MICNKCNSNMIWQSDFNPDEYGFDEDVEGIVTIYLCPECDDTTEFLITENEMFIIFYDADGSLVLLV